MSFSDLDVDVNAATDNGELDPGDGDVIVCEEVSGGGWRGIECGEGPGSGPPREHSAAEVIRPRPPAGEVK